MEDREGSTQEGGEDPWGQRQDVRLGGRSLAQVHNLSLCLQAYYVAFRTHLGFPSMIYRH